MARTRNSKGQFVKGGGGGGGARRAPAATSVVVTSASSPARSRGKRATARRKHRHSTEQVVIALVGAAGVGYLLGRWLQSEGGIRALNDAKGDAAAKKPPSGVLKWGTGLPMLGAGVALTYGLPDKYKAVGVAVAGAGAVLTGLRISAQPDATGQKVPPVVSGSDGPDLRGLAAIAGDDDDDVGYDDDDDDGVGYDDDDDDE